MRHARPARQLLLAVLVGGLVAAALGAQTTPSVTPDSSNLATTAPSSTASASLQTVDGKVISTSASSMVVETDAGKRLTFNIDTATAQPASLAAGDRVTVRFSELAGASHADTVTLTAAPPSPATTPATTPPATETTAQSNPLPRTASRLPLILLVGTLAALVAFGIQLSRERG